MGEETLHFGVISTANIGRKQVVPAIQRSRNSRVVAVASRDSAQAADYAAELGIDKSYVGYEALLDDPAIDAVYNPLPNSLHRVWTVKAAEAGKHVLCEKPLAVNASEAQEMVDAAKANGVRLMEAFMYRFHPQTERVVEMVQSGTVGDLRLVRAAFSFPLTSLENIRWSQELSGGALMDVGCYCVNVSRTIFGAEPVEVQAAANWAATGVDAELAGTLRFEDGGLAQFDCALTLARREVYEAAGTEAAIRVPVAFLPGTADTKIQIQRSPQDVETETIPGLNEYQAMAEHFADCVRDGKPFRYPAEEAVANMRVIDALLRSARNGGRPERCA